MVETLSVYFDGIQAAVISFDLDKQISAFQYTKPFCELGIELAPLHMPLDPNVIYSFPALNLETFRGLPGMVADSLPDTFGTAALDRWLSKQNRSTPITPLERLQYTGMRGMGALEYRPSIQQKGLNSSQTIEIKSLLKVAQDVINSRLELQLNIASSTEDLDAMQALLAVGTSAGGARPKVVLAFNHDFTQVRSGQVKVPSGFEHYLLKFDGIAHTNNTQETFGDPVGYGVMEYVYFLMAKDAGIDMTECRLLDEGSRRHFVTKRFDRCGDKKFHTQTLTAIDHVDYHQPGSYSYEQLFQIARKLRLPKYDANQIFLRMCFNFMAHNNDDHSKNFGFILKENRWRLSPAYDVAYSYKPGNAWVEQHWMSANSKRQNLTRADLLRVGQNSTRIPTSELKYMIQMVYDSVQNWEKLARENEVPKNLISVIDKTLPLRGFKL